jgi:hypothetical protein
VEGCRWALCAKPFRLERISAGQDEERGGSGREARGPRRLGREAMAVKPDAAETFWQRFWATYLLRRNFAAAGGTHFWARSGQPGAIGKLARPRRIWGRGGDDEGARQNCGRSRRRRAPSLKSRLMVRRARIATARRSPSRPPNVSTQASERRHCGERLTERRSDHGQVQTRFALTFNSRRARDDAEAEASSRQRSDLRSGR